MRHDFDSRWKHLRITCDTPVISGRYNRRICRAKEGRTVDIRAMNKRIELYRERTEKIRAEYRERQQQAQAEQAGLENPNKAAQAETVQTQDGHDDEAHV